MIISDHFTKEHWTRRVTPDGGKFASMTAASAFYRPLIVSAGPGYAVMSLTQDDFLNEIEPTAHIINSKFMSQRAIYGPSDERDADGKVKWEIKGYDNVETVALGLQKCFAMKKASHFAADGFWTANESKDDEAFQKYVSWCDRMGLKTAFMEAVSSCFQTGDAAIYPYMRADNKLDYEVFSYLKGDMLFPDIDENGDQVLYRKYQIKGRKACDIFYVDRQETWVMLDDNSKPAKGANALRRLLGITPTDNREKSEDGYTLIRRKPSQTGGLQAIYFRVPDIPSGPAQQSIEALEKACSYISEEVKSSAFPILFLKSEKIVNLPPSEINGKTIGVKGSTDSIAHSDAKFLTPPDASNIATINTKTLTENILRTTMSVFVEPDILRSGADSSTTIKIMFAPEIAWCQNMWVYFEKPVRDLADNVKTLVGKVEGDPVRYENMPISTGQNIWIPQNVSEQIKDELDMVYARVKSRKAAMEDLGNEHLGDFEQIEQEWEKELDIKARIPAVAKAEVDKEYGVQTDEVIEVDDDNPNKPKVDNKDKGKSITE